MKLKKKTSVSPEFDTYDVQGVTANQEGAISKEQMNVIKTMIIISVTYAITTLFVNFGYATVSFGDNVFMGSDTYYYAYVSLYFMNSWLDPFIYAFFNKEVRQRIRHHLFPKKFRAPVVSIHTITDN